MKFMDFIEKYSNEITVISVGIGCAISFGLSGYTIGASMIQKEAITNGHAVWVSDEIGNPKFMWKEQKTIIGEYLGLGK